MTTRPDRWDKAADRDLARRQRDAGPLFAPLVERRDPAVVQARAERNVDAHAKAIAEAEAAMERRGQEARAILAAHVSTEELAELDRQRGWYPPAGGYTADHYCGECRKRGLPWPGQAEREALRAEVARLESVAAEKKRAQETAAGEQMALPTGLRVGLPRARIEEVVPAHEDPRRPVPRPHQHRSRPSLLPRCASMRPAKATSSRGRLRSPPLPFSSTCSVNPIRCPSFKALCPT